MHVYTPRKNGQCKLCPEPKSSPLHVLQAPDQGAHRRDGGGSMKPSDDKRRPYFDQMRACAFCKKYVQVRDAVKYSTRRYAHAKCFFNSKGYEEVVKLPEHSRTRVVKQLLLEGILT